MGRRTSLVRRPTPRSRFEAAIKAVLFAAAVVSVATTLAIVFSLLRETISFFGDVPIGDYLFGTKWTPQFAGDQQSFGVLPLVWGTLYLTGDRPASWRSRSGSSPGMYLSEFAPRRVRKVDQADARGARRRADDRVRLLRADVLHARGAAQRARHQREPVQRAVGGHHPRHPRRPDDRDARGGRDVGRARSRCARAPPGSAPTRSRPRSASSSRPRSPASWPRSCSARRARSARR